MKKQTITLLASLMLAGTVAAQSFGQADAPAAQARSALAVKTGKVIDIQPVQIEVQPKQETGILGGVIGAAAGAYAARESGWQGQTLAGTIGAALGNKAAAMVSSEKREAEQVVVKLDDGQALAVIQEPNGQPLSIGQPVYIIGQHPALRVMPARQ